LVSAQRCSFTPKKAGASNKLTESVMPLLRNCLIAIAATSAQADLRGFLQVHNATTAVVTQELGEDVKVGDYDAVMAETEEDNSEEVDEEETTETEGGLTESEVEAIKVEKGDEVKDENKTAISFVQVEQEPESDVALFGQQQLEGAADSDVALYGGASVEETASESETQETQTEDADQAPNDNEEGNRLMSIQREESAALESGSDAALYGGQGADESDAALYGKSFVQLENTTSTVVTQELGEDVKVGDYDAVMDETEDNSDDVDEDETTEDESSGFSESEVEAIKSEKGDESVQDVNNKTDAALVQAAPVKKEVKKVAKEDKKAEIKYDKKKFAKDWHKEWKHGDVPSYKETYSKDTFPGRKAVVAAEDSQSDGKPGPAGITGPVGAHLKHSKDGTITR